MNEDKYLVAIILAIISFLGVVLLDGVFFVVAGFAFGFVWGYLKEDYSIMFKKAKAWIKDYLK